MRVAPWCLSSRRVGVRVTSLLVLTGLVLFFNRTFCPDYLLPTSRLSAVPLPDFFWLGWVAGDYFQPRQTLVSPVPQFCRVPRRGCKHSTFMLVLVPSPPQDFSTRRLIRDTWSYAVKNDRWPGARMSVSVEVFFVLGMTLEGTTSSPENLTAQLRLEAEVFDDLIVGDFADTYRNLTLKTLTGLNWAWQHCGGAEFVMKLDQDTLVDFPRLTLFLLTHRHQLRHAVLGKQNFNSKPRKRGQWKVLPSEYPLPVFPTFADGPCYMLSSDVVRRLVNVSQYMPPFFLEDVQVTGILARVLGVRHLHVRQLLQWREWPCVLLNRNSVQVIMKNLTPEGLRTVWTALQTGTCS